MYQKSAVNFLDIQEIENCSLLLEYLSQSGISFPRTIFVFIE